MFREPCRVECAINRKVRAQLSVASRRAIEESGDTRRVGMFREVAMSYSMAVLSSETAIRWLREYDVANIIKICEYENLLSFAMSQIMVVLSSMRRQKSPTGRECN